jgi:Transposase, Mutator family
VTKTSISWQGRQEGSLREGLEAAIRERVREIIEMVLEEEVEAALGAPRSQRVAERSGYRHGRKSRRLTLRTGTVHVTVPRARLVDVEGSEREWQSQLVPRYRRSSLEVEQSVLGVYLSGSNTRRIRRALEPCRTPLRERKKARLAGGEDWIRTRGCVSPEIRPLLANKMRISPICGNRESKPENRAESTLRQPVSTFLSRRRSARNFRFAAQNARISPAGVTIAGAEDALIGS